MHVLVSTITKDLNRTEKTNVNLKCCTRFCKQWRSKKGGQMGAYSSGRSPWGRRINTLCNHL